MIHYAALALPILLAACSPGAPSACDDANVLVAADASAHKLLTGLLTDTPFGLPGGVVNLTFVPTIVRNDNVQEVVGPVSSNEKRFCKFTVIYTMTTNDKEEDAAMIGYLTRNGQPEMAAGFTTGLPKTFNYTITPLDDGKEFINVGGEQ